MVATILLEGGVADPEPACGELVESVEAAASAALGNIRASCSTLTNAVSNACLLAVRNAQIEA